MRLLIDSLICVMVVGLLAGLTWHHRESQAQAKRRQDLRSALMMLHDTAAYHRALDQAEATSTSTTVRPGAGITPAWFADGVPSNEMVPGRQPWLDVAPKGDLHRHPPDPVITSPDQAGFWYNPRHGVFRARVMPQATAAKTMELYNLINQSSLKNIEPDTSLARRPELPMVLSMPRLAKGDQPVDLSRTGARVAPPDASLRRNRSQDVDGQRDQRASDDASDPASQSRQNTSPHDPAWHNTDSSGVDPQGTDFQKAEPTKTGSQGDASRSAADDEVDSANVGRSLVKHPKTKDDTDDESARDQRSRKSNRPHISGSSLRRD